MKNPVETMVSTMNLLTIYIAATAAVLCVGTVIADPVSKPSGRTAREFNPRLSADQVENQIALDRKANPLYESRLLAPLRDAKETLMEEHGLSFSLDYSALGMAVTDSVGPDNAASGIVRFFGSWSLLNRGEKDSGSFIWKLEHRHRYTETPPGSLGLASGYAGIFEPPFSDQQLRLTNMYWKQYFFEGKATAVGGFLDMTDFVDVYLLASPWTGFNNFVFSTGSAAMDLPNDAGLGAAAGGMISEEFYIQGGFSDPTADPTDPFNNIYQDGAFFKYLEFGWTPKLGQIYFENAHLTLWHMGERDNGTPDGWGFNLSYQTWIDEKWLPFVRFGYADDSGSLLQKSFSMGVGYQPVPMRGVIGLGLNWGEPNEASFGKVDDQFTGELFWRYQLTKQFAVTPSVQYINNPALNSDSNNMWAFGIRARFVL